MCVCRAQIHNWATELTPEAGIPSLEFVAPTKVYVVVNGERRFLDLSKVPALSPRQLQLMAKASISRQKDEEEVMIGKTVVGELVCWYALAACVCFPALGFLSYHCTQASSALMPHSATSAYKAES